jgi:membrane protein involved in colicin uptake
LPRRCAPIAGTRCFRTISVYLSNVLALTRCLAWSASQRSKYSATVIFAGSTKETNADKAKEEAQQRRDAARKAAAEQAARKKLEKEQAEAAARQKVIDQMAAQRAAAEKAASEKREAAAQAAEQEREEQEQRDSAYTKETVDEVIVDYPQMAEDAKVITSGYFNSLGQLAALSSGRISTRDIYLDTSQLSRETRLVLLKCQDFMDGCLITIWAHRGCTVTAFGVQNDAAPCFVVEAIRPGTYAHPAVNRILR